MSIYAPPLTSMGQRKLAGSYEGPFKNEGRPLGRMQTLTYRNYTGLVSLAPCQFIASVYASVCYILVLQRVMLFIAMPCYAMCFLVKCFVLIFFGEKPTCRSYLNVWAPQDLALG